VPSTFQRYVLPPSAFYRDLEKNQQQKSKLSYDRRTVSLPVCFGVRPTSGPRDQFFFLGSSVLPLGRPRHRWVDNIRMELGEVGWGDVD
jgi:hypothetical protein